jgi:hypothetical protein
MTQHTLDVLAATFWVGVFTLVALGVVAVLSWLANRDWGTPAYRSELEATYASFRRFLMTVQAVVIKRLQE